MFRMLRTYDMRTLYCVMRRTALGNYRHSLHRHFELGPIPLSSILLRPCLNAFDPLALPWKIRHYTLILKLTTFLGTLSSHLNISGLFLSMAENCLFPRKELHFEHCLKKLGLAASALPRSSAFLHLPHYHVRITLLPLFQNPRPGRQGGLGFCRALTLGWAILI